MTFISLPYALFLLSVIGLYWTVQRQWLKLWTLLFASLVFYASLQIYYLPLLLVGTWLTFRLGLALGAPPDWRIEDWEFAQQDWSRRRIKLLWLGIVLNVLLLLGFKYVPFLLDTLGTVFHWSVAKEGAEWTGAYWLAPLGLSFFCFECIAYLVDVYRGADPARHLLKFSAYKLFFPKLISGPITRYHAIAHQFQPKAPPQVSQVTEGLWLIACGAVKKGILADNLGVVVNLIFDNLERTGSGDLWLATFAYGFQLYLDFSGYVDIARGSAILLGFNLPENFDFPYFTTSIADFWRRWHMTLGDWLRNYLYFPLGGSRRGLGRTCLNLMIVMVIAGLWHNPGWGFILWGALHGLALVIHRLTDKLSQQVSWLTAWWQSIPGIVVAWFLTQFMVFTTWIFFRLPDLKDSFWVVGHLFGHTADAQFAHKVYTETIGLGWLQMMVLLWTLVALMAVAYLLRHGLNVHLTWHLKLLLVPLSLFAVWLLAPEGNFSYIYFEF